MTEAEKYYKLRWLMSGNVKETWEAVSKLAAIACWVDWDTFDAELEAVDVMQFEKFACGRYRWEAFV